MTKLTKMMEKGMDYGPKMAKAAKDYMPSAGDMAKKKMMAEAHLAKGLYKAMPSRVKKMELAKLLILPATAAVTALLFAPKSGRELRADIKNSVFDLKDQGMDKAKGLMSRVKEEQDDMMEDDSRGFEIGDEYSSTTSHTDIPDASNDPAAGVGDVKDTPYEPNEDQTVPADKLDEALADVGASTEDELLQEDNTRM